MRLGFRHRMPTVELAMSLPSDAVWDVLVDLTSWPKWGPTVAGAELDEPGPLALGIRGKVWTPVGVPLPFEINEFIDGRVWAWRVAGVPATRHEVIPTRGGCVLSMAVPIWAPAYLSIMAVAVPRIERLATTRAS
ncbi:polyketide cyclase [Williamsia muralis]|uniref:Polyketide cyclase n=2 Tax=Williamsia marianensis TaxID=85044 RepID=A0A2G3PLA4_WILMA|nr:SRPBCC family protein [Williamsia marianensis]PHV66609.1 polyketide cyclase [Williamsia marianensis]